MSSRRQFVRVGDREVHYIRAGEGPPVVLLHYAEVSADSLQPLTEMLAEDHTVFAFDLPGHGDSDPLAQAEVEIADVAEALYETLLTLNMPPCPIFGTHTGAAVALELAHQHPEQASAVVIDGPCMFEPWEAAYLRSECFLPKFAPRDDGSHLFSLWVRVRDGILWIPWNKRQPVWRFTNSLPEAGELHYGYVDVLRAGDKCNAVYRAAITDGRPAAEALTVPATFMASSADILFEHLDRLPELRDDQEILRVSTDGDFLTGMMDHLAEAARVMRRYRCDASAPGDVSFQPRTGAISRRYVDLPHGQVLVRSLGEEAEGRPVLLIHDGRAGSRTLEPLMRGIGRKRPVYALDLPDNGASDPLPSESPDIAEYAAAVAAVTRALDLIAVDVYAVGSGAAVGLELHRDSTVAVERLVLDGPDFYEPAFAQRLLSEWAPEVEPSWEGAHLNRVWLMLRDEYPFWPWFDKTPSGVNEVEAPSDWTEVHARAVDIIRSLPTYHRLTSAALRYEWSSALAASADDPDVELAVSRSDPRRAHVEAAAQAAGVKEVTVLADRVAGKANDVLEILDRVNVGLE